MKPVISLIGPVATGGFLTGGPNNNNNGSVLGRKDNVPESPSGNVHVHVHIIYYYLLQALKEAAR